MFNQTIYQRLNKRYASDNTNNTNNTNNVKNMAEILSDTRYSRKLYMIDKLDSYIDNHTYSTKIIESININPYEYYIECENAGDVKFVKVRTDSRYSLITIRQADRYNDIVHIDLSCFKKYIEPCPYRFITNDLYVSKILAKIYFGVIVFFIGCMIVIRNTPPY